MVDLQQLTAPFAPDRVSWRVGSTNKDKTRGMALAFIDARDVMDRLDTVCGVGGWQNRYPHANGKTVCEIGIRIGDDWIWKSDGAGDTDFEAEKGALSDAFKRAAVRWGVGRYLYDLDAPWVEIEPAGKSYKIADRDMPKLRALLGGKPVTAPAQPKPTTSTAAAKKYKDIAEQVILSTDSVEELRQWWSDEKGNRHLAELSKADEDDLLAIVNARKGELTKPNSLSAG